MHGTSMVTELFQTYEGELVLVGPRKLLWHRLAINPQSIQVLSKKQRKFPFAVPPPTTKSDMNMVTPPVMSENTSKYGVTRHREEDPTDTLIQQSKLIAKEIITNNNNKQIAEHDIHLLLTLLSDTLPVHRYEESALDLVVVWLIALGESKNGIDKEQEQTINLLYIFIAELVKLFTLQGDNLILSDATTACAWYRRAEQIETHVKMNKNVNEMPMSMSMSVSAVPYTKLTRACKLAGDVIGHWHYALSWSYVDCVLGEKEMKKVKGSLKLL